MSRIIIDELRTTNGLSKKDAEVAFEAVVGALKRTIDSGQRVVIPHFGVFSRKIRPQRVGRNPRTGEEVVIAERTVTAFKESRPKA